MAGFIVLQLEYTIKIQAFPEGRLSGDDVAVLRFPECLLDGLLAAAPGPLSLS